MNDYRTIITELTRWALSDIEHLMLIIVTIGVIGAFIGIGRSLAWCKHTRHIGRRVL